MHGLGDILANRSFDEPTEVTALKQYVFDSYEALCRVQVAKNMIIITVASASLAGMIRMNQNFIKQRCGITQKLIIRIGSVQ